MNQAEIHGAAKYNVDGTKLSETLKNALTAFQHDNALVELNFVSKNQIRKINLKYRQIDKSTDVLSFPQVNPPNVKIKILGNIVISPEIVIEKNEDLSDVAKHGLLHLLGYDHESDGKGWSVAAKKIDCKY